MQLDNQRSDKYIISIDPGITRTGIIVAKHIERSIEIISVNIVNRKTDWYDTSEEVINVLDSILENDFKEIGHEGITVCIEEPVFYLRGGNRVIFQSMFVGAIIEHLRISIPDIMMISNRTAKLALAGRGNAEKAAMIRAGKEQFSDSLDWDSFTMLNKETIADAIGIGLAYTKQLNGVRRLS